MPICQVAHIHQTACVSQPARVMQLTVVLLQCLALVLKCRSQDITESDTQYSTEESSAGTRAIDWDTADPPVKTTLQNAGRRRYEQNTRVTSDYTAFYRNHWRPMMMPMMQPPFGTRISNADIREKVQDTRGYDPNERRQKELQGSLPQKGDQYPKPSDPERNPMTDRFIPYSPYMFYDSQNPTDISDDARYSIPNNSANDVHPLSLQDLSEKMNISASSPDELFYRLPNDGLDERFRRMPFPLVRYAPPPGFFLHNRPDDRHKENIVPYSPYALPPHGLYPPLPPIVPTDDNSPQVYPQLDFFYRPQYFDRESGTQNFEAKELPPPFDSSITDVATNTPVPLDTVPEESLPKPALPINPFPFGFYPQGLAPPPFIPLPQGEIPPPILPPRLIPNPPVSSVSSGTPVNRLTDIVPPPPAPLNVPPPAVDLPSSEAPENLPSPVPDTGMVSEALPPQGGGLTEDRELYEFGFDMNDGKGTDQHRQESKDEAGVVTGSYGYRDAFGVYRLVNYIADKNGYRAFIQSNEPGVANPGSADVVVMAERPPPQTVAESLKPSQPELVEVPDDLIVQASETK